jgi:hypothetical protein
MAKVQGDDSEEVEVLLAKELRKTSVQDKIFEKIGGSLFKFKSAEGQERLVHMGVSKIGSLEVTMMMEGKVGKLTFLQFMRNLNY